MDARTSKLGEYLMYAADFNRYEVFAGTSSNYATIEEADAGSNGQGDFELYYERNNPSGDEKRVLVESDHVYGLHHQIELVVFDIVHISSSWQSSQSVTSTGGQQTAYVDAGVSISVRPVTSLFSAAEVTWNSAQGLSYGDMVTTEIAKPTPGTPWVLSVEQLCPDGHQAGATIDTDTTLPGLFMFKRDEGNSQMESWNALAEIYGWELRIRVTGNNDDRVQWVGDVSDPGSVSFVVLA